MAQQQISRLWLYQPRLPSVAIIIVLIGCFVLNVGLVFFPGYSPVLGVVGLLAFNLIIFLFLQPHWAIPLYLLVAAPGLVVSLGSTGILAQLYPGIMVLALLVVMGLLAKATQPRRKSGQSLFPRYLVLPLIAMVLVGLASLIYARLQPDPAGVYLVVSVGTPIPVLDTKEVLLLLGLPVILIVSSALIRRASDVKWIIRAYIGIGLVYALGTIVAAPLGFYSDQVILGVKRPEIFGLFTSGLGLFLVLFATIALGQALYACTRVSRFFWWACTVICSVAVIMTFGRTSWLALGLSVLVMLAVYFKKLSVLLPFAVLFALVLLIPGVSDFFNPDKVYGLDRLTIWQDAISLWLKHPLFGVGAGNFQFFDIVYGKEPVVVAHNQFLEILAEMGLQGLLCFIWSLLAIGWFTFQRFKAATTSQGKAIALAYIGYYITIIFGGFFIDTLLPSVSEGGGTAAMILAAYHWLLLGVVLTIPQWEKAVPVAAEADQPVRSSSVEREAGDVAVESVQSVGSVS